MLSSLSFYQNADGGFGHALEPDCWNPDSSPYTTLYAANILKGIGAIDKLHPVVQGIFNFLQSGAYCSENGWYFSIPSNSDYAHAPWWSFSMKANETEDIGLTAELAGFILQYGNEGPELYKKALAYSDMLIQRLKVPGNYGEMGIGGYCTLLESIKKAGVTSRFDCSFLEAKLAKLVHDSIERDVSKWTSYTVRPSNYITSPDSIFYKSNEDIVVIELDYLIDTRPKDGVWDITWSWFENNEKYSKEFAISENWWKASKAIEKVNFLRSFGRVEI